MDVQKNINGHLNGGGTQMCETTWERHATIKAYHVKFLKKGAVKPPTLTTKWGLPKPGESAGRQKASQNADPLLNPEPKNQGGESARNIGDITGRKTVDYHYHYHCHVVSKTTDRLSQMKSRVVFSYLIKNEGQLQYKKKNKDHQFT